jgi:hypothetical protein
MGRIFLWARQGHTTDGASDLDDGASDVNLNLLVPVSSQSARELRFSHFSVLEVPVGLSLPKAIAWINGRAQVGDIALALETAAFSSTKVRGTSIFYLANNTKRCTQAEQLLQALAEQVPALVNQGAQPDTATASGSLAFTRQIKVPSLVLRLGFVTNLEDQAMLLQRSYELACGLFNGLARWSRSVSEQRIGLPFPPLQISINGQNYDEPGILVEDNVYVPADLMDQCALDLTRLTTARWFNYGGITYIRAIDLREVGVFVGWEAETRTALLQTLLSFKPEALGDIMGPGYLLPSDYEVFLQQVNPAGLQKFPDIAQLYQAEAAIEGVNPDVAFAQALVETNCLSFSALLEPTQNNFGSLGSTGGSREVASFPSARIGVRAHIQHLKAYANKEPLVEAVVDPRFHFITRGVAPSVAQLSRRWSAGVEYGECLLAMLKRLYGSAGLL